MKDSFDIKKALLVVFITSAFVGAIFIATGRNKSRQNLCAPPASGSSVAITGDPPCLCDSTRLLDNNGTMVKGYPINNRCYFCPQGQTVGKGADGNPVCVKETLTVCDPTLSCEHQNSCNRCEKGYLCDTTSKAGVGKCTKCTYANLLPLDYTKVTSNTVAPKLNTLFSGKCYSDILTNVQTATSNYKIDPSPIWEFNPIPT